MKILLHKLGLPATRICLLAQAHLRLLGSTLPSSNERKLARQSIQSSVDVHCRLLVIHWNYW